MSFTGSSSPADTPRAGLTFQRIARLALKELRETLRDRRTIITLVLMPILVYPLLSLALRQFLLGSLHHEDEVPWRIAAPSEEQLFLIAKLVKQGDQLLHDEAAAPNATGELGQSDPAPQDISWGLTPHLEMKVRDVSIDLGVRIAGLDATTIVSELKPPIQFELIFRANSPSSRRAASYVERRLGAANQLFLRTRLAELRDASPVPAQWRLVPLAEEEGEGFWLGTLIPLILILMTITGAVYPAIDLTAGERERGTLEALMAAPVPRLGLLVAKYVAVLTVAILTAVVNLTAMTITIAASGLGNKMLGEHGLTVSAVLLVLALLLLFAAFFSAVLLSVTSFARSFKEAQAYVIPLMLVSMTPGLMSVVPGLRLGPVLAVMPLANMVLLTRDVMQGSASPLWGTVAVLTTVLYGSLALALAARVFGNDAVLYGSDGSWSDLFRRPREPHAQATIAGALATLAIITPLFIVANGFLGQLSSIPMANQLMAGAATTLILFLVLPLLLARLQGVALTQGFQLRWASPLTFIAAALLGCTLWPLAYDLIVWCHDIGLATVTMEKLAKRRKDLEELIVQWRALSPVAILLALAVAPAVCEEFFFRGYLLGALRGRLPAWAAIGLTGAVFGLFHASVFGMIAVERVLSSTLLGIALAWICWTTRSVLPGMVVHMLNNGLMLSLAYWGDRLQALGWDAEKQRYLPLPLVIATTVVATLALVLVAWTGSSQLTPPPLSSQPARGIPPPPM